MHITPLSQNNRYNTNFKELHVTPQALKAMGITREALLQNPVIEKAANTFQVLVKPSKSKSAIVNDGSLASYAKCWILFGLGGMCVAAISGLNILAATFIGAGLGGQFNMLVDMFKSDKNKKENLKILVQCGEKYENGKLSGVKTQIYEIDRPNNKLPNMVSMLANEIQKAKFAALNPNDLFTSDKYLSMLKELRPNKDIMHKKVNDKGDTLLTQFFEVSPDENRTKYKQIINILKNIRGLDYNQEAAGGVSCLQRIMFAENFDALDLVKDFEFNYKPELTDLFVNIENQNFKEEVLKLNIKFNDILKAVEVKSDDALKELEPQLDSPLCNRAKLAKEIEETLDKMNEPGYAKWFKSIYHKYMNTGTSNLID